MKKEILGIAALVLSSTVSADAWRCGQGGQVEYTDQPCQGGEVVELEPVPPPPKHTPSRLVIEYRASGNAERSQSKRSARAIRELTRENARLKEEIGRLWSRKEAELRNAAITDPERMAAINLYWQARIDSLERQIDRNLAKINALK